MSDQNNMEKKLLDNLQQYLHQIASEAKKKHPPLKEAAESGIVKIRAVSMRKHDLRGSLLAESGDILEPFFMACDTKSPKLVQISLTAIQRLITFETISTKTANNLVSCLWQLMENGIEELKLLQTVTLLISTNHVIQGDCLAKAISLCFRLHFTKNSITNNTASATIRQLVTLIFERVQKEDEMNDESSNESNESNDMKLEEIKPGKYLPKQMKPAANDAFLFFQDIIQLVNADQPYWLTGLTEMTRTFGLDLLELIFTSFPDIFYKHQEFSFLVKERVCQLVIKLFSPNIKQRTGMTNPSPNQQQQLSSGSSTFDKPFWPITVRLMRIVAVLIQRFYTMLITESEIFLSLLVKSLESDKPNWQRSIALEALHKMIQPSLISSLCRFYDMKPQSSKIFRDIVNALCIYTQSQFLYIDSSMSQSLIASIVNNPNNSVNNHSNNSPTSASPITPQPAFLLRGIWIPILFNLPKGSYKPYFIDQLDKLEVPTPPDGHGMTTTFACFLEIVSSITCIIEGSQNSGKTACQQMEFVKNLDEETRSLHENLLSASWSGLLGSFSLLLDASTDEAITELILKTMQKLASLYGIYSLDTARDGMITSICKSSLPPHYSLPVLNILIPNENETKSNQQHTTRQSSIDMSNNINISNLLSQQNTQQSGSSLYVAPNDSSETRQQVVAVGTPLPSAILPQSAQQGPVMLTSKNLQCMNAILSIAHTHGCVMQEKSWHIILTTLQHLVWILGLKPTTGGTLKVGRAGTEGGASTNALITTAVMSDLPVLSAMLSRLFESSHYAPMADLLSKVFQSSQTLTSDSLIHLVNALVKLSQESMEICYNNREPSLFAIAKLLETGLVNIKRIDLIWKPMTAHFLEACQHPHVKMREWGVEALCSLVKSAIDYTQSEQKLKQQSSVNEECQEDDSNHSIYLTPLQDLSYISHSDIRQKQLDCTLQILHSNGDTLYNGWPQIFEIVGAINDSQNENSIRCAFQCLQLIISDFLALTPPLCLILCVDTTAKFASQTQELNVSLTAIGLLWNIADYLHTNQDKIKNILNQTNNDIATEADANISSHLQAFDCLWMAIFSRLGGLCTDSRPAIRKSAAQTLFSTLNTHGSILEARTWHSVLWSVLFPLLNRVRSLSSSASNDKITENKTSSGTGGSILLHHSRNTAQKQWSETQVLVLSGVCRVFVMKKDLLITLDDFSKSWTLLLEYIESSAMSKSSEVSLSALKCFQDLLSSTKSVKDENELWMDAWNVWYNIGISTAEDSFQTEDLSYITNKNIEKPTQYIPSQAFLTALIQIFPHLFLHIKSKFKESDFIKLSSVLHSVVSIPITSSDVTSAYILSSANTMNDPLTPLQESVLLVIDNLQKEILHDKELNELIPSVFNQLLAFSCFAVNVVPNHLPFFEKLKIPNHSRSYLSEWSSVNGNIFFPFGERCLKSVMNLYQQTASTSIVIQTHVLHSVIKTLKISLCMKYSCPSQSTWKLAVNSLINVLQVGLPVARQHPSDFVTIWGDLALTLEGFLFPISKSSNNQSSEEQQFDESLDVKIVELIRDYIMPYATHVPKEFLLQIVSLLNKGSIHSATSSSPVDTESARKLREEFARACFETLLQFSFLGPRGNTGLFIQSTMENDFIPETNIGIVNKLAVSSLLQRFNEVVVKYVDDEKLCPCPLPRHRMAEISFVLKALATLVSSLKKAPPESVEPEVWLMLIGLYPHLVDCTTSNSIQVNRSLREVLHQYSDLLSPPSKTGFKTMTNGC